MWAASSGLFTDSWPREHKPVFTSTHSREETERNSHDKSKETKTAAVLRCSKGNRYGRKGGINGSESLQGRQANSYGNPNKWEENQMTKDRWYSPRLERKTVRRLYVEAKLQGIPMTVLANQLVEDALGKKSGSIREQQRKVST